MSKRNILDIYNKKKTKILRPVKPKKKGYLKIGSIQSVKTDMFGETYLKIRITGIRHVDINMLTDEDYQKLGYYSKQDYLNEKFNKNNPSKYRIEYSFEVIESNIDLILKLYKKGIIMKTETIDINKLISPDWNPRNITDADLKRLERSIDEFGYIAPIVVNDVNMHVVGGNQRLKALKTLGYTEVDVVYVHIEDITKEKACNVALNKISGQWDNEKLKVVLEEIQLSPIDINLTGFEELELKQFDLFEDEDYLIPDDEPEYDESIADDIEVIVCPSCGYEIPKE